MGEQESNDYGVGFNENVGCYEIISCKNCMTWDEAVENLKWLNSEEGFE